MGAFIRTKTCTIANGESLSGAVYVGGEHSLVGITYPAAWTAAGISFQVSFDGVTYQNLRDDAGNEVTKTVTAGQFRELDASEFKTAIYLKVRSGTAALAVAQLAARTITLHTRRYLAQ